MLKSILKEFLDLTVIELPEWLDESFTNGSANLKSYIFKSDYCRCIRLCELNVANKFQAETLVIYPEYCYDAPIFGTEYLKIGNKKYFGAIDFHPINGNEHHLPYIEMFPNRKKNISKFYNLDNYFTNKLWLRKSNKCFYNEYQIMIKCYLHQYKKCLFNSVAKKESFEDEHNNFNRYMSSNDPAFGILKSYFNTNFTEKYIQEFLFN
jgi:hypothetical protein